VDAKTKGEVTEAIVLSELVKRDVPVLTPFGENHRYDFVVELADSFHRLQCKTARREGDRLRFQVNSTSPSNTGQTKSDYKGDVDYFVTHSRAVEETYLVPIDVVGTSSKTLRLEPPENNQSKGIDMAADYALDTQLNAIRLRHDGS
jgi:hypothetical protein